MSSDNRAEGGESEPHAGEQAQIEGDQTESTSVGREALSARLDAFSTQFQSLRETLEEEQERRADLEDELDEERTRRAALEEEIEQLHARTDLLRLVETSDQLDSQQRAGLLIQHLRRAAQKERDRGRDAKASVNRDEAERALQFPDVDRTTIYTDMRRAVRLVDNESVLWYDSQSGGESRLKLNLDAEELPKELTGHSVNHGGR